MPRLIVAFVVRSAASLAAQQPEFNTIRGNNLRALPNFDYLERVVGDSGMARTSAIVVDISRYHRHLNEDCANPTTRD
jgi:hypothetical protein